MKSVQITIKGTTKRKLEKFASEHPEGCYVTYNAVIEDLLNGKVKNRIKKKEDMK